VRQEACTLLRLQWSHEQISSKLHISHEKMYQHLYADKARGGALWKNLRCQKQKRKRYAGWSNLRGHIPIWVKTLTYDNGKEFAWHSFIYQEHNSTAYFARPFASWERGSNENLNGLLRQYIPKMLVIPTVSGEEI